MFGKMILIFKFTEIAEMLNFIIEFQALYFFFANSTETHSYRFMILFIGAYFLAKLEQRISFELIN